MREKPLWRGVVVIVSANGTADRGFESRQGVRFLGVYTYLHCNAVLCILIRIVTVFI
jgi:hypothetical protein